MEIDKNLYNEIKAYCELNNLKTKDYIHKLLKKAFLEDKYGKVPAFMRKKFEESIAESEASFKIEKSEDIVSENKVDNTIIEKKENSIVSPEKKIVKTKKRTLYE